MSWHYLLLYTSKKDIERNNKEVELLVPVIKKSKPRANCALETLELHAEKWHLNQQIGAFKEGMDVIMLDRRIADDNFQIFNINTYLDLPYYSVEEAALMQSIRVFLLDTERDGDYSKEFWDARDNGGIICEEIKRDEWVIPDEYKTFYEKEYKKTEKEFFKEYGKPKNKREREDDNRSIRNEVICKIEAEEFKKKTLEHPYLFHTLRYIDYDVLINACKDLDWLKKIVEMDGSILPLLIKNENIFYIGDTVFCAISDEIITTAIKSDYTAFSFFDFIARNIFYKGERISPEMRDLYLRCLKLLDDKEFIRFVLNEKKTQYSVQEANISILARATKRIRSNKELVELAVSIDPLEFCYASKTLRKSEEFVTYLFEKDYWGIAPGISKKLNNDTFKTKCWSIYCRNHNIHIQDGSFTDSGLLRKKGLPYSLIHKFSAFDNTDDLFFSFPGIFESPAPFLSGFEFTRTENESYMVPNYKDGVKLIDDLFSEENSGLKSLTMGGNQDDLLKALEDAGFEIIKDPWESKKDE